MTVIVPVNTRIVAGTAHSNTFIPKIAGYKCVYVTVIAGRHLMNMIMTITIGVTAITMLAIPPSIHIHHGIAAIAGTAITILIIRER